MKKLLLLLLFPLTALGQVSVNNTLTIDPYTPAQLVDVDNWEIFVKYEHCNVSPDVLQYVPAGSQLATITTFVHQSVFRGDHCYKAQSTNTDGGRSADSNTAYKYVKKLQPDVAVNLGAQ